MLDTSKPEIPQNIMEADEVILWSDCAKPSYAYAKDYLWIGLFFLICTVFLAVFDPIIKLRQMMYWPEIVSRDSQDYFAIKFIILIINFTASIYCFRLAHLNVGACYHVTSKRILINLPRYPRIKSYALIDLRSTEWSGNEDSGDLKFNYGPPILKMNRPFKSDPYEFASETLAGIKRPREIQRLITEQHSKLVEKRA